MHFLINNKQLINMIALLVIIMFNKIKNKIIIFINSNSIISNNNKINLFNNNRSNNNNHNNKNKFNNKHNPNNNKFNRTNYNNSLFNKFNKIKIFKNLL